MLDIRTCVFAHAYARQHSRLDDVYGRRRSAAIRLRHLRIYGPPGRARKVYREAKKLTGRIQGGYMLRLMPVA